MQKFRDLRLAVKLPLTVGACCVLFAVFAAAALATMANVRVGGPRYHALAQNADLVADVLPPPEYLVETNMVVLALLGPTRTGDTASVKPLLKQLDTLRADYETRHQHWAQVLPANELRTALV